MFYEEKNENQLLSQPPVLPRAVERPIIKLSENVTIDDNCLSRPMLITGQAGSGKSKFLINIAKQISTQMNHEDLMIIFAAKNELVEALYNPQTDRLISINANCPENIYNIVEEVSQSEDPEQTALELAEILFSGNTNKTQPFFMNAAKDIISSILLFLARNYEIKVGRKPNSAVFIDFLLNKNLTDIELEEGKIKRGLLSMIKTYSELKHLERYIGDGNNITALGVLGEMTNVIRSAFNGAFSKEGTFTAHKAVKEGGKVFLIYDFANSSQKAISMLAMILDQLIKLSLSFEGKKSYFILDEFSLLPPLLYLKNALSYGRAAGFHLIAAIQSATLLQDVYQQETVSAIMSLFPNSLGFFTNDIATRDYLKNKHGKRLYDYMYGTGASMLIESDVIRDRDFFQVRHPGNCICSLCNGISPFILRTYDEKML